MAHRICRLAWGESPTKICAAAQVEAPDAWLVPARWSALSGLQLGGNLEALLEAWPECRFGLEWQNSRTPSPAEERLLASSLRPWLLHLRAVRLQGRPVLWVGHPETISQPRFTSRRLRQAIHPELVLLAAGPPHQPGWDGIYDVSSRLPCQQLRNGRANYETFLYLAHHRRPGNGGIELPCVVADPEGWWAHSSPRLYQEWLLQAEAWSSLRHRHADERWLVIDSWAGHQDWAPSAPRSKASYAPYPPAQPAVERRHGTLAATDPALLVHGYHLDLLETMLQPLAPGAGLALYVSTPLDRLDATEALLRGQGWQHWSLVGVENRGRDIAPFLIELLPRALATGHPWLVKVHTKRSPDKPGGARWGQELLRALATPQALESIGERFTAEPAVQLLVPGDSLVPTSLHLAGNEQHVLELLTQHKIDPVHWLDETFVAGSMWAARSEALRPLLEATHGLESYEAEAGQTDNTLAHAWERLFPCALRLSRTSVERLESPQSTLPPFGHPWAKESSTARGSDAADLPRTGPSKAATEAADTAKIRKPFQGRTDDDCQAHQQEPAHPSEGRGGAGGCC